MIISLFGPDGAGKSTLSRHLADVGWRVFSGTDVSSWPDQSWIRDLNARGIDEPSYDVDEHFLEKIRRAHQMARHLEAQYGHIVIDSDPLHKTLIHDYSRGVQRFDELYKLAFRGSDSQHIHVAVMINDTDVRAASILHRRIVARKDAKYFDPKTTEQSLDMIRATRQLIGELESRGEAVEVVTSDQPAELTEIIQKVCRNE